MTFSVKKVIVIGGGLGGLATAIALRQSGFEVRVFEQSPELGEIGAGVNLASNAAKVFQHLGLGDALHAVSFEPKGVIWRDWVSGDVSKIQSTEHARERYGAPYYVVHRSDLHRVLSSAFPSNQIFLSKHCVSVESNERAASVTFADGTHAEADLIIGADGIRSAVRQSVFGGSGPRYSGFMCWRALTPTSKLPATVQDGYVNNWAGPRQFVISYYIRKGEFVNLVAVKPQPDWNDSSWSVPSSVDEMVAAFSGAGDRVKALLSNATTVSKWGQFTGDHAEHWIKGRVVLLGDAAHAMLATFGQGAAMAFEDAYVIARWLHKYRDDGAHALASYVAARKPRTSSLQAYSRIEVGLKNQQTILARLKREWAYFSRFGITTRSIYSSIYGYDPVTDWSKV